MAIVRSVHFLRPYLKENRFTVRTDHDALKWNLSLTDFAKRLARWRLGLAKFEFDVIHRTSIKHQAADAILRLNTSCKGESPLGNDLSLYAIDNFDNPPVSVHTVAQDENRARKLPNTKTTDDKPKCDLPTTVKIIRSQQQDTFCFIAKTQV